MTTYPDIEHGGIIYRIFINRNGKPYYMASYPTARRRKMEAFLHRQIWKEAHGEIPNRHHIHHIDDDTLNNNLNNLLCLTPREHTQHHLSKGGLEKLLDGQRKWQQSPVGVKVMSQNATINGLKGKRVQSGTCGICGNTYCKTAPTAKPVKYCSRKCAAKASYRASFEKRTCSYCNSEFETRRTKPTSHCSLSCGQRHRRSLVEADR